MTRASVNADAPSQVGTDASVSSQLPDGITRYLKGIVGGVRTWDEGSGDDARCCRLLNEGGIEFRDALSAT